MEIGAESLSLSETKTNEEADNATCKAHERKNEKQRERDPGADT